MFCYDQSGRLIYEKTTSQYYGEGSVSEKIMFLYDESGIIGMTLESTSAAGAYYFQRNLQGDVIAIYDSDGNKQAEYAYDAFGNCEVLYSGVYDIGNKNPIRSEAITTIKKLDYITLMHAIITPNGADSSRPMIRIILPRIALMG